MLTSYPSLDPATAFCRSPASRSSSPPASACEDDLRLHPRLWDLEDLCWRPREDRPRKRKEDLKPSRTTADMEPVVEPEEDLQRLIDNDLRLRLSGYYYGCLSWAEAACKLRRTAPGTFLVRDSEHACYLYALSVQTPRGPTSCRIEYHAGRFRLDSARELTPKMPRFESVSDLVDHYVRVTGNLPRREKGLTPVWLDMDEENSLDVPVQICRPLYREVRGLQHLCRVALVQAAREKHPESSLRRTLDEREYRFLPTVLKDYLREYPYSQ